MQIIKDREYLHKLERLGKGAINWEFWDKLIILTRNEYNKFLNNTESVKTNKYNIKRVFGYNNNGVLIKEWVSNLQCSKEFKVNSTVIHKYSKANNIINNILISRDVLTKDRAFALYRFALENGNVYNNRKTKPNKTVYQYNKDGQMIGVFDSLYQWCKCNEIPSQLSTIRNRLKDNNDIIVKDKMITYNFYDELIAKETYEKKSRNNR